MTSALFVHNARVLTLGMSSAIAARRGAEMRELGVVEHGDVLIIDGRIVEVTRGGAGESALRRSVGSALRDVDARGRVLLPGLVDCHTHLCWAGSRMDEWEKRLAGAAYLDILRAGGGIMATVRAVRAASVKELTEGLAERAEQALALGSTTIEVKTGYGLTLADELKMLEAIGAAQRMCAATLAPTALIGHAIDADDPRGADAFVAETIERTLPAISQRVGHAEERSRVAVDAFCEQGAWSVEQCVRLFEKATTLGHPVRVHTDQFNSLGMIGEAIRLGARSVDHLEATSEADLAAVGRSSTVGVLLPCTGFHLDGRYARGRAIVDAGGAVAIATNANPGSAPCWSMPMAIALAVRHCGLTVAEAIIAATVNGTAVLGLSDRGVIAPGARGDAILLRESDERSLAYEFGTNPVETVIKDGAIVQA